MFSKSLLVACMFTITVVCAYGQCPKFEEYAAKDIQEYVDKRIQVAHPCVGRAIASLEKYQSPETIAFLLSVLDFRDPLLDGEVVSRIRTWGEKYPAAGVLVRFGQASIQPVVEYLGSAAASRLGRKNAQYVLSTIVREPVDAIQLLRPNDRQSREQKENLKKSALDMAAGCIPARQSDCKRAAEALFAESSKSR